MNRENILKNIKNAKKSHLLWLRRAKHLISGLPIDNDMIPLSPKACEFGGWLYSEGMKYKVFSKLTSQINEIEREHSALHKVYLKIYKIYFVEKERHFLSKFVFGKGKKLSFEEKQNATYLYYELEHISENLSLHLDNLMIMIKIASDETIEKCVA